MKYFSIKELTRSDTANRLGIDNSVPKELEGNLVKLIENLLDPIREKWGKPIRVNSGYRCPKLNKAVGGVPTSEHVKSMAADVTTGNKTDNIKLFNMIKNSKDLKWRQLILEKGGAWIHISYNENDNKKQIIYA